MAQTVTVDVESITLREYMLAEQQSGMDVKQLLSSKMAQMILVVFVDGLRNSAQPRSWQEVENLRLLDALSSTSDSPPAAALTTSPA